MLSETPIPHHEGMGVSSLKLHFPILVGFGFPPHSVSVSDIFADSNK